MMLRPIIAAVLAATVLPAFGLAQTPQRSAAAVEEYCRHSLAVSAVALAASRMAQKKAQMDDLREFARLEEEEQATLAEVVTASGAAAAIAGNPIAGNQRRLDRRGRLLLWNLRAKAPGAAFDRAYLAAIADAHAELLGLQEDYLAAAPGDGGLVAVARLARTLVREHLQLLADIETTMESGTVGTTGDGDEAGVSTAPR